MQLNQGHSLQGNSLIEVMVTLLVISVGLLGLAGLQTQSLKYNHSSLQRTQATILAYDILDRMRANRSQALDTSDYVIGLEETPVSTVDCDSVSATCTAGQLAKHDLDQWRDAIADRLPDGVGSVSKSNDLFIVTVRFSDYDSESDADGDANPLSLTVRSIL